MRARARDLFGSPSTSPSPLASRQTLTTPLPGLTPWRLHMFEHHVTSGSIVLHHGEGRFPRLHHFCQHVESGMHMTFSFTLLGPDHPNPYPNPYPDQTNHPSSFLPSPLQLTLLPHQHSPTMYHQQPASCPICPPRPYHMPNSCESTNPPAPTTCSFHASSALS
jgi:hypothetical protein